jgi:putative peptidoglycan lipid II flippase
VGIFGVSMATAIFTPMSRAAAAGDMTEIKRLLVTGLEKTLFLSIPASLGMILIARPLITLVYLGGNVTEEDIDRATWASILFCLGIWAFEAQMVIVRAFYVRKDTRTPTKVALAMIGLNLVLNLTLVWFLREGGIALATTIAAVVQVGMLLLLLRKQLGPLGLTPVVKKAALGLLAAVAMVEVGYLLSLIPMPWEPKGILISDPATRVHAKWMTSLVKLPLLVGACGVVYLMLARWLGVGDLGSVPFVGRFFRRR